MKAKETFILCVVVYVLFLFGIYFFIMSPILTQIKSTEQGVENNHAKIEYINSNIKLVPILHEKLTSLNNEITQVRQKIIYKKSLSVMAKKLSDEAKKYQVKINAYNFISDSLSTNDSSESITIKLPIFMDIEASYLDFGIFIENLDKLDFIIIPEEFYLDGKNKTSNQLSIKLLASIYIYNE